MVVDMAVDMEADTEVVWEVEAVDVLSLYPEVEVVVLEADTAVDTVVGLIIQCP